MNVRINPDSLDFLEAAAFVRRFRGLQELLRPIVEQFAEGLAKDPEVHAAVRARRDRDARASSKVERLPERPQPRNRP